MRSKSLARDPTIRPARVESPPDELSASTALEISGRGVARAIDILSTRWDILPVQGGLGILGAAARVLRDVYIIHHALFGYDMRNIPIGAATLVSFGGSRSRLSSASLIPTAVKPRRGGRGIIPGNGILLIGRHGADLF